MERCTPPAKAFMRASLLLLALLFAASSASAQRGEISPVTVEQMGNFEIQDLIITITYETTPRGSRLAPATVTVQAPDGGRLGVPSLYLGGALGDEISTVALREGEDGVLTGRGMLPPPGTVDAYQLRMDEGGKMGLKIGLPPDLGGDFRGGAEANGIKIVVSMDWPLDVDIVIET
jgi:hypothetical protein